MSDAITGRFVLITAIGAAIFACVEFYVDARLNKTQQQNVNGATQQPRRGTTSYTARSNSLALNLDPDPDTFSGGTGNPQSHDSNGHVYTKRFTKGGNPNSAVNYEQSFAIQSATKNPFANGPNNSYARAVNAAPIDPSNQATTAIYGHGGAPAAEGLNLS